jgi:hypothetical protein
MAQPFLIFRPVDAFVPLQCHEHALEQSTHSVYRALLLDRSVALQPLLQSPSEACVHTHPLQVIQNKDRDFAQGLEIIALIARHMRDVTAPLG